MHDSEVSLLLLIPKLTHMINTMFVCFWLLKIIIMINTNLILEQTDSSMAQLSSVDLNIYSEFSSKIYKRLCPVFGESSLVPFQVSHSLAHPQLWSIDKNIRRSCFL